MPIKIVLLMHQETPLKDFQGKAGDFLLRLNLVSGEVSDVSHYHEGLSVYAANYVEKYCFEEFYNIDTIPSQALTIFFDLQTFFDYIVQNHADPNRVSIGKQGMVVCNIIKARGVERRQEVILEMSRKPLELLPAKEVDNPQAYSQLLLQNERLKGAIHQLRNQVYSLAAINRRNEQNLNELKAVIEIEKQQNHRQILQQESNTQILTQNQQIFKEFINTCKVEQRYLIEVINQLKRDMATERQEKEQLKEQIRQLRRLLKEKGTIPTNPSQMYLLGQKVEVTIDRSNPYLNKYAISDNTIEKIDGDETRFQILGNQVLGKTTRCYFEVRIINLLNSGLIIGVVSEQRRGQRHSYDQRDCVCYDGTGKVFEMGKKWPVPVKFQAGQVVRVQLDLQHSIIRWFISYTEIGSVLIPETLRNSKLVPYLQLNEVKDKINLNK